MKGNFKATSALVLLSDPQITTSGGNLAKLQDTAIAQLDLIRKMESESALRAVLVGLALHRIKASLKHGEFGKWQTKHVAAKKSQVGYYMRLALVCLEDVKFNKQDLVAIASGSDDLVVASDGPARKAFNKIEAFVGDKSLNELLIEHDIKNGGGSGGGGSAIELQAGESNFLQDVAEWLLNLRKITTDPEKLKEIPKRELSALVKDAEQWLEDMNKAVAALTQK